MRYFRRCVSAVGKNEAGKWMGGAILDVVVRVGLEQAPFEQRLGRGKGAGHVDNWGQERPTQRDRLCRVPESGRELQEGRRGWS